MNKPVTFSEKEYIIFKVLFMARYQMELEYEYGIHFDADVEVEIIHKLFTEKLVSNVTVNDVKSDIGFVIGLKGNHTVFKDEPQTCINPVLVGTFNSYRSINKACFTGDKRNSPRNFDENLHYLFVVNNVAADCFIKVFLEKWQKDLLGRYADPFLSHQRQFAGVIRAIHDELERLPPNNLFLSELSSHLLEIYKQSLPFCVFAYLHLLETIQFLGYARDYQNNEVFHLSLNESFLKQFGACKGDFEDKVKDLNFWHTLDNPLTDQIQFANQTLSLKNKSKRINNNTFPFTLLTYAKNQPANIVVVDRFIAEHKGIAGAKDRKDFDKKMTAFRSACKRALGFNDSFQLFPTKNGEMNLSMIKFRE